MKVRLRFDGSPGPEGPRFIEAENMQGESIRLGEWVKDEKSDDWFLVFDAADPQTDWPAFASKMLRGEIERPWPLNGEEHP